MLSIADLLQIMIELQLEEVSMKVAVNLSH